MKEVVVSFKSLEDKVKTLESQCISLIKQRANLLLSNNEIKLKEVEQLIFNKKQSIDILKNIIDV